MMFSECWSHGGKTAAALLISLAMVNLFSPKAAGQQVAVSEVDGRVTDPSGQAIAGATVKMTEVDKQLAHTATTDSAGRYQIPNLPAGVYQLAASAPGFKNYVQSGITLQVGNNIEILIPMQVGSVSENIEVRADASMVETKENAIAQVIDQQRMVDLPLNGRNPTQLITLTGASAEGPSSGDLTGSKNMQGSNGSKTYTVAGGQANGLTYLLDGGDNNDAFSNVNLPLPFPDAIQEFSVQTSATGAQLGLHPGGVVNIVTKSGSNAFHGDVFEFLRNYSLNARQDGTLARDSLKRSQFGGVAGGRIIRDKLFFFGGYQGTRQRSNPAATQAHVPTAAALNGDFSILDAPKSAGGCQNSAVTLKDPTTGQPFPGNQIPANRFDPAALKLVKNYIPVSDNPCGLVLFGQPANNPDDQWIGRIDYVRSTKQSIYARYYLYDYTAQTFFDGKNALTTGPNPGNQDRSQTFTLGDIYSVSSSMVNAFHATFARRRDNRGSASNLFSPTDLGVNMFVNAPNYTQITVSNYFNVGCGTCALAYFDVNTFQVSDDYSIIKGRHQIGFGFDGRKLQFNSLNNQQANGQITFNGNTTGDALADLMIGRMSTFVDGNALSDYIRQTVFAFYVQDTFRATPHLTINLGFRWEPSLPAYDKYGRGNQFNAALFAAGYHSTKYPNAPAGLLFDTDAPNTHGKAFTASHWLGTSPRIGLVWDPAGDGKQTIRIGGAIIHDTTELFYPERWTTNPPYASSVTLTNPTAPFSNPWLGYPGGDPFPGAGIFPVGGTYVSVPPNVKPTYMAQWNLSYQRQVANNWLVTLSYVGNKTTHVLGSYDVNPSVYIPGSTASTNNRRLLYLANPAQGQYYSNIEQTDDGGISHYNALLVSLNHRFSHGFTVLSNYTWSHCVSDVDFTGELAGTIYQNPNNRSGERASCGFDHRQIFNTSLVAISGGLGTGLAKKVTREWELAPLVNIQSGAPYTPTDGGTDISQSGQGQDRPNVVVGGNIYEHTQAAWFNPLAFAAQPAGTFGNAGRFSIVAPGSINWDMAVSRNFAFKERYKVMVRADFFNIMNHPNWLLSQTGNTTSRTSSLFGQITQFSSPRIIQMAMKFYF